LCARPSISLPLFTEHVMSDVRNEHLARWYAWSIL
jgi:hypothetical protein